MYALSKRIKLSSDTQMALQSGNKLGPYEIVSPIGKGGMGEVWKARATRGLIALSRSKVPPRNSPNVLSATRRLLPGFVAGRPELGGNGLLLCWSWLLLAATCFGVVSSVFRYLYLFSFTGIAAAVRCKI